MNNKFKFVPGGVCTLAALLVCSTAGIAAPKKNDPVIPVGSLSAYPTVVQTGTHPTLNWDIQYPESAADIVTIGADGSLTPKVDLCMEVRVLGASYQVGWTKKGQPVWGYVQAELKYGSNGWNTFFLDTQDDVWPTAVYHSQQVLSGNRLDFRGRAHNGWDWITFRTTQESSPNVVTLVDGDMPPSTVPAFSQGSIESFLDPYIDGGGYIDIGPKDVIVLFELGQTNTQSSGFDLQDLVLLVTFDYCKNNNGHGNNTDGVDSSNPGKSKESTVDESEELDDDNF